MKISRNSLFLKIPTLLCLWLLVSFKVSLAVNVDSLVSVWEDEQKNDSTRLSAIHSIAWSYIFTNPDTSFIIAENELVFAQNTGDKYWEAKAYHTMGTSFYVTGKYEKAHEYYQKRLAITLELDDKAGLSSVYNNIGNIYVGQELYPQAFSYYHKSLEIKKEISDMRGVAGSYANMAIIYSDIGDYDKALEYNNKAIPILIDIKNDQILSNAYNNVGVIYEKFKEYEKAIEYHEKSLGLKEKLDIPRGIIHSYNNLGINHMYLGNYDVALKYYNKGLALSKELDNKEAEANNYLNQGTLYVFSKKFNKAIEICNLGMALSTKLHAVTQVKECYKCLSDAYEGLGDLKTSYSYYRKYTSMNDSIRNAEINRDILRKEYQFEYEKKAATDSIKNAEAAKVKDAQLAAEKAETAQQKQKSYFLSAGLLLTLFFGVMIYNRLQVTRKQKGIIEEQKEEVEFQKGLVEEKNEAITDSIRYAEDIQLAIIPSDEAIKKHLPESFVFFRPKDIVSGDFYWMHQHNDCVYFAACDCTGHGVPGAFMSMIGSALLTEAVVEKGLTKPADIFTEVRKGFISSLKQKGETGEQKDGMDAVLCAWDKGTTLQVAAAFNPLLLIRNGEIIEVEADRLPVGFLKTELEPYTHHELQLEKGDTIYIFSDGYKDQFGGPKLKRFMQHRFSQLLLSNQDKTMEEQKSILETTMNEWIGEEDQIDDMLVMGVRF